MVITDNKNTRTLTNNNKITHATNIWTKIIGGKILNITFCCKTWGGNLRHSNSAHIFCVWELLCKIQRHVWVCSFLTVPTAHILQIIYPTGCGLYPKKKLRYNTKQVYVNRSIICYLNYDKFSCSFFFLGVGGVTYSFFNVYIFPRN